MPAPLDDPLPRYRAVHRAIAAGLVRAAHDPSEGGLAVALAELAIAGRLGISVDAFAAPMDCRPRRGCSPSPWAGCCWWSSAVTNGALQTALAGLPLQRLGTVEAPGGLRVRLDGAVVVDLDEEALVEAWRG